MAVAHRAYAVQYPDPIDVPAGAEVMVMPETILSSAEPGPARELDERGFTVLPGPVAAPEFFRLQDAYDAEVAGAAAEDMHVGRTSTRVNDFVNRGSVFEPVYTWPVAIEAASRVVGGPSRLSVVHARTVHAGAGAQGLHVDLPRSSDAWPMLGLILMVDAFRTDNGATRFVPGSHRWMAAPAESMTDLTAPHPDEVLAIGPAGSVILFHASTWHGHAANVSGTPRRSLQATYIPRAARPATDFGARMRPETRARLGAVALYLTGVD